VCLGPELARCVHTTKPWAAIATRTTS
jgi:hypothetical protein